MRVHVDIVYSIPLYIMRANVSARVGPPGSEACSAITLHSRLLVVVLYLFLTWYNKYCKEKRIHWLASAWDLDSLKFLDKYDFKYNKIASPMLASEKFLNEVAERKKYTFI